MPEPTRRESCAHLAIWQAAEAIEGTLAERYIRETRGIRIGLADLRFEDLSLVDSGTDTLITNVGTNATIALVHGIDPAALGAADFLLV